MAQGKLDRMVRAGVTGEYVKGSAKYRFHFAARKMLRAVAKKVLGLSEKDFDLRTNKAGIAVSGETTLHTEELYIQISSSWSRGGGAVVLVRRCNGRKDYKGESNNFCEAALLEDPESFQEWLERRMLIPLDADKYGMNGYDPNFQPSLG